MSVLRLKSVVTWPPVPNVGSRSPPAACALCPLAENTSMIAAAPIARLRIDDRPARRSGAGKSVSGLEVSSSTPKVRFEPASCIRVLFLLNNNTFLPARPLLKQSLVTALLLYRSTNSDGFGLTSGGPADRIESKSGADAVPDAGSHGKRRIQI